MGSALGVSDEKILALPDYATSPLYEDAERAALGAVIGPRDRPASAPSRWWG